MVDILIFENRKVCLMKGLILLLHLIIALSYLGDKIGVKFNVSCLKQDKIT